MQGREFVFDVENREFRDEDDPENTVDIHSGEGRRRVREMAGTEWRVYRVVRGQVQALEA